MGTVVINSNTFNVYGTQADAIIYMSASLDSAAWDAASSTEQAKAMVTTARLLDRQRWIGTRVSPAPALAWPRTGVVDRDGNAVSSATVPLVVEQASYELANLLLGGGLTSSQGAGAQVKRAREGDVEIENFHPVDTGRFPTVVQELLGQFLREVAAASEAMAPFVSGTDVESQFDDPETDAYKLLEGLS